MSTPLSILIEISKANGLKDDGFTRLLSDAKVKSAKSSADKPAKITDGGGLVLYVPPSGAKTWRYRFRLADKEQTFTIGGYPEVSLADAREAHRAARWLVERGESPLPYVLKEIERQAAEKQAAELSTFSVVVAKWLDATKSTLAPRTVKHREAMVFTHIIPTLGDKPVDTITRQELRELLVKLDAKTPETAKYCRVYLKQAFDWAVDAELIAGNPIPPARIMVNHASRKAVPRKALQLGRLGEFIKTLADAPDSDPRTKAALKLLILTWCRTGEVIGARWSEFDLDAGVWAIPAERMKAKEVHTVYLSSQAVDLLRGLPVRGEFVFPNKRDPQRHMNRMTLTAWRQRWGFADVMEIHGLRAVCSTWANESGKYRPDVVEVALAHKEQDRVRAAYNRALFTAELRQLWQDWADLCDEKEATARADNVVPLEFGRAA